MKTPRNRIRTWIHARPLGVLVIPAVCGLALTAGTLLLQAQTSLSDLWIRFPDGTVQTTAAHNCFNPADPDDEMIRVGGVCIDKYEVSVWSSPTGGTQYGVGVDDYPCSNNGQDCFGLIYARSVPNVQPSAFITWFQAQQALANAGKRLPTNAEWQMAVAGTPDPGGSPSSEDCNTNSAGPEVTGERTNCISDWGTFDMVGNVWEWVADLGDDGEDCSNWSSEYGDDLSCVGLGEGETNSHLPGALHRGGGFSFGADAGPFSVIGISPPSNSNFFTGFRGAR